MLFQHLHVLPHWISEPVLKVLGEQVVCFQDLGKHFVDDLNVFGRECREVHAVKWVDDAPFQDVFGKFLVEALVKVIELHGLNEL